MNNKNCCLIFKNEVTVSRVISSYLEKGLKLSIIIINKEKIKLRAYFNTLGIDVKYMRDFQEKEILNFLNKKKINYLTINFKYILSKNFFSSFKGPIFAVHGGDLPKYRGPNMMRWMVADGLKKLTSTLFLVKYKIDSGQIIAKKNFKIKFPTSLKQIEKQAYYKTRLPLYNKIPQIIKTGSFKKYTKKRKNKADYHYTMHHKFLSLLDRFIK